MPSKIGDLDTPCVVIDVERVEANLKRAQEHADANGYRLRPHIKTHKLPRWAKRQVELGATGITCQKLGEAEVMADAGITDIFVPYNILGDKKLARLRALNARVALSVTADSPDTVAGYARTFTADTPLTVLVECDTGTKRCGVQTSAQALALARQIVMAPGLKFGGLMTYPPARRAAEAEAWLREAVDLLTQAGIPVPRVTSGNTPDMWRTDQSVVTERRPGTYIYFDRTQVAVGAADWDNCALTVLATVVSRPTPNRVIIDAGSKSLSSDLAGPDQPGYGLLRGTSLVLERLNEEHGIIEMTTASDTPRVGDRVHVIPNHVCVVTNLFDEVHLVSGDGVVETVPVAARGRVG
jgi:D-serine deaminase-like pyridoxal phosphate-dependent protein